MEKETGIIYLVQPALLVGTQRFKIGCSSKNTLDRMKNYRKGTRYLYICECENPFKLEKIIKESFNNKFILIAGREFFKGNEQEICKLFLEILYEYKNDKKHSDDTELNQCSYCNKSYKQKQHLTRHLKTCKVKKEKEKEIKKEEEKKKLELELAKKQIEILKLQAQVASGNTNCNNTNTNNTVNNTVNVTVNDYGKENINFLESNKYKKLITQILGNGMLGLQEYIKYKYCNPQQPENLTIKYTNDRSNNLKVRTNNEWKTRNKLEVIDELYDRDNNIEEVLNIYECINDLKDDVHMDKIQVHFVDEIDKYYDDDDDDKEIEKEMRRIKNKTLNHFYDCYKQNKNKFE